MTPGDAITTLRQRRGDQIYWRARIIVNRAQRSSYWKSEEDAAAAYDRMLFEIHGEFASTNGVAR